MTDTENPSDGSHEQYATTSIERGVEIARREGFCLLKGFFEPAEIAAWERSALALGAEDRRRDFMSHGRFDSLLFHDRVLELARKLMGPRLVYYGETNCSIDVKEPFRSWHFDARGMPDDIEASYEAPPGEIYGGWRFAVYFRDYRTASDGLKVCPGAHMWPIEKVYGGDRELSKFQFSHGGVMKFKDFQFKTHNVPSQPGDFVVFNLRTAHSAGFVRLKDQPDVSLPPDMEQRLLTDGPSLCVPPPAGERNALIFDYATPTLGPDLYIKWRANRILNADKATYSPYTYDRAEVKEKAAAHGISLRYDRIIAQLLHKYRTTGRLDAEEESRLGDMIDVNQEFSPHHSMRKHVARAPEDTPSRSSGN